MGVPTVAESQLQRPSGSGVATAGRTMLDIFKNKTYSKTRGSFALLDVTELDISLVTLAGQFYQFMTTSPTTKNRGWPPHLP